jgi:hypothetical protein
LYVRINNNNSDPLFWANSFWDLPTNFLESIAKKLLSQQREAANTANFSAATSAALLNCIIAGLGGSESKFDPAQFLPCSLSDESAEAEDQDYLEVDSATLRIFFDELEAKRIPGWVFSALSNNFSHWRKQIA